MAQWLEIAADTRCNNRCLGCDAVSDDGPSMATRDALAHLGRARAEGTRWLWLGGGEPTLRRDLFTLVAAARELGYSRIKLQTNGMMLAYPDFARRCFEAGVSEVNLSIKGAGRDTHDRLTGTPGCWDLLLEAIANWRRFQRPLEGDLLVYQSNLAELPEMVRSFHARGLERFNVHLFAAPDSPSPELDAEVPRLGDLVAQLCLAMDLKLVDGYDFVTSLHSPPCVVPKPYANALFFPAEHDRVVASPGGLVRLEQRPSSGGSFTERCAACVMRPRCGGLRSSYLRLHGDAELQPLSEVREPGTEVPLLLLDKPDVAPAATESAAVKPA